MKYKCPKCGRADQLDVYLSVWARIVQTDPENVETDMDLADEHDHEWDGNSGMICRACGHGENADKFENTITCPACKGTGVNTDENGVLAG